MCWFPKEYLYIIPAYGKINKLSLFNGVVPIVVPLNVRVDLLLFELDGEVIFASY
jgi:hypothetical protein